MLPSGGGVEELDPVGVFERVQGRRSRVHGDGLRAERRGRHL